MQKGRAYMLWERNDFHQDFQFIGKYENVRGIYHPASKRSVVYLVPHENIHDIIATCIHETLHSIIDDIDTEGELDEDVEHDIIHKIQWAEFSIGAEDDESEWDRLTRKFNRAFSKTQV